MAEQDQTPVFQLQRMYLKDLSLELEHGGLILLGHGGAFGNGESKTTKPATEGGAGCSAGL